MTEHHDIASTGANVDRLSEHSAKRLLWLGGVALLWGLTLAGRLIYLQILHYDEWTEKARMQQQDTETLMATRGAILDRESNEFAVSRTTKYVVLNPKQIADTDMAAGMLARFLHMDKDAVAQMIHRKREAASGGGFLVLKRKLAQEELESILNLKKSKFKGLALRDESVRIYPKGSLASHVIGAVDHEDKGSSGIELGLEDELQGLAGSRRVLRDSIDRRYGAKEEVKPVHGKNIWLTIDERIQFTAEQALKSAAEGCRCKTGSVVVMDPRNGDILAMANYPSFDPNDPVRSSQDMAARLNLAVAAPFEPGSVFKVFTLSAALETTDLGPESPINCLNGSINLHGRVIHEAKRGFGVLPMRQVLARSSNVGAIQVGLRVGSNNLYKYLAQFGFGKRTGVPLPSESGGLLHEPSKWDATSIGSVAMGHAVMTTTLQLAQAGSVIANNGYMVRPRIVLKRQRPGAPVEWEPSAQAVKVLNETNAFKMRDMMHDVVLPGGTGTRAQVAGYLTGGKTGSAQIYDAATKAYTHKYNASFLGMVPLTNPRLVVVVTLNGSAEYGGTIAAPVFREVAAAGLRYLEVPRDIEPAQVARKMPAPDRETENDASEPLPAGTPADETPEKAGAIKLATAPVSGARAPNLMGKTMRAAISEATKAGLVLEARGAGVARSQRPPPGKLMARGDHIVVEFRRRR
ncbi:MAG: transpeptidase family protein [Candidatus Solibacter usitatus]|nr:transpeptidase family protein [Candidatus Solibacter usitatus]